MKCIACDHFVDTASGLDGKKTPPRSGDVTICLYCGHIMVFHEHDGHLVLRNPNSAEQYAIAGDPDVLAAQRARMAYLKSKQCREEQNDG